MSARKKARRALKDFVLRTAETLPNTAPEDQYVRTPNGRLFLQDLRTLLQAEREVRTDAQEQRERANRAETEVARQAGLLRGAHKDADVLESLAASVPALRRLVEKRGGEIKDLTSQRDKLRTELDTLRAAPGTVNYQRLWEAEIKNRDAAIRDRDALQRALNNSVRKGTPPFVSAPGGPSAEDLRKLAEQFLSVFLPRDKQ